MRKVIVICLLVSIFAGVLLVVFSPILLNNPPAIGGFSPSEKNIETKEGNSLTFFVSGTDCDGDLLSFTWALSGSVQLEYFANESLSSSSWIYNPEYGDRGQHNVECTISDGRGGYASMSWTVVVHYIELDVVIDDIDREWGRSPTTDLPVYKTRVSYSVYNYGDTNASDVQVLALLDGENIAEKVVSINADGGSYSNAFIAHITYDSTKTISLQASTDCSSDSENFQQRAFLVRWPVCSDIRKLYITPNDPTIQSTVRELFEGRPWWDTRADWKVITDWVKNEIGYEHDEVLFDKINYWQLPRETLAKRKGDCEDQAILLCTLLRARGYEPDEAYVILGYGEDSGHAWVVFKVFDILGFEFWRYLEATTSGWGSGTFDLLAQVLGFYESECGSNRVIFNDKAYENP